MNDGITGRIARTTASRPWITIAAWLVTLVAAIAAAGGLNSALTQDDSLLITTESGTVTELDELLRDTENELASELILVRSSAHAVAPSSFGDSSFMAAIDEVTRTVQGVAGVSSVEAPSVQSPFPVSQDGSVALVSVGFDPGETGQHTRGYVDTIQELDIDGFHVTAFGMESGQLVFEELAEQTLVRGETIGIGVALVILAIVFGALVAAGIPLVVAVVSITMSLGAIAIVGQALDLSFFVVNMVTMMGLALGIDYSLIMVQRFREELAQGRTVSDAVGVAGATANRAVLFSGITVVISLVGLFVVPSTMMRSLGAGAVIVAIMSVVTALTLLPAVLKLLGHRVNKARVPFARPGRESRVWSAVAAVVIRRPVAWGAAGLAVLGLLAVPALGMRMATPGLDSLPADNELRVANETLVEDFGMGRSGTTVVIENASGAVSQVESLAQTIEADAAFAETQVEWVDTTAFIDTRDVYDSADPLAADAIERLRDHVVPDVLAGTGTTAHVGGDQAADMDFARLIFDSAPWVLLIVLSASFVLLLVAFRSVVVPAIAIALNLLSTAAAFGLLVVVFQWGLGASLLGLAQVDSIAPWIPLFLFAVLFGLSMDYHVFLLSRVKERFDLTGDTEHAVSYGLRRTGSLITGAALIMVAVFGGFALGDLAEFSQMGFGLAAAVIIDATIVRSLLVPAIMAKLGNANWYLPSWLAWLPQVSVEGPDPVAAPKAEDEPEEQLVPA